MPFLREALICGVLLLSVGCRPPAEEASDLFVTWDVQPDPPRVGEARVTVALADSSGSPVAGADVDLEGTMTHPGMQPASSDTREVSPGRYEGRIDLSMRGDWVLLLEATLADGRKVSRQKDLRVQ